MNIQVNVINQKLRIASNLKTIISGTQEFVQFEFAFDDGWDGITVFAQFRQGGKAYDIYLDDNNCVYLPPEITPGECILTLYGTRGLTIATTNYISMTIDENMFIKDADNIELTEPLYNQLVEKVHHAALPYIAENGNWYYDNEDTGISALGGIVEAQEEAIEAVGRACEERVDEIDAAINRANSISDQADSAESARVEAEKYRVIAEQERETAEDERRNAESQRTSSEDIRIKSEEERIAQEQSRINAEAERVNSETERRNAETQRAKNEFDRQAAEDNRSNAESARANAESQRQQNEVARQTVENDRDSAETERKTAENTRKQNESARQNAENERTSAENTRKAQESERQTTEAARVHSESERENAENEREANEAARQTAEEDRIQAEATRSESETLREKNEIERQNTFAEHETLIQEGNEMIEKLKNMSSGVSPTVEVSDIDGGHRVSISDYLGTSTFDVMDGNDGAPNEIDTTLSISGAAADAAVTGRRFEELTNIANGKVTKGGVSLNATDDGAGNVTLTVLSNS